ncbi:MAG: hypothetical protein AAGJ46_14430 [Planctomycetota bacterium]
MAGIYQITIEREGHQAAPASQKRVALKRSFAFIAALHHRLYKMLKFRRSALRRYGLKPRSGEPGSGRRWEGSYAQAKVEGRRLFAFSDEPLPIGENKPFVWAGRTRSAVAAGRRTEAAATSAGRGHGTAVLNARQLNRAGRSKRIDLIDEMKRVTEEERAAQEVAGMKHYEKSLQSMSARSTYTAKG